ncbi:hypothetical protein ACIBG8_03980 [Nonomuraea sp. NPDC050556]|uniref:hypothetical protein n=1 Tax=Nonomuraea sp. NPDC050556 TaxID=3364369 RepID=UPI00379CBD42
MLNTLATLVGPTILYAGVIAGVLEGVEIPDMVAGVGMIMIWAASLFLAVRAWRLAIVCLPDRIVIRGYLRSRSVPISRIVKITDAAWPELRWEGRTAGFRSMYLTPLIIPSWSLPIVKKHVLECRTRLEEWIGSHG